jgi:hypothetical protein
MGQVEMQGRDRNRTLHHRFQIGARLCSLVAGKIADPDIRPVLWIASFDELDSAGAAALSADADTGHRLSSRIGEIHVHQHARWPAHRNETANHLRAVLPGDGEWRLAHAAIDLAQRDRGHAKQCRFHGRGNGAGIGHVLAEIGAAVHTREHQIGRRSFST